MCAWRVTWPWLLLLGTGCPAEDGDGATVTSTATSTASGSASATSTSTGPIDDVEAFCAMRASPDDCSYFDEEAGVYCAWWPVTPVTLSGGTCELAEPVGACLAMTGGTTSAGCIPPPGCEGEPWFRVVDGTVNVSMQCGGSAPIGYEPCTWVEPGVFDPVECGCLCDEPLDPDSSGG